ncbi:MAG: hypothetical protein CMN29_04065 [Sandaracinus sp.]|nr:hypothetical protein [Myxococcales bacterium]MAT24135.1 hypothetical protein [Sandaracinus sp.]
MRVVAARPLAHRGEGRADHDVELRLRIREPGERRAPQRADQVREDVPRRGVRAELRSEQHEGRPRAELAPQPREEVRLARARGAQDQDRVRVELVPVADLRDRVRDGVADLAVEAGDVDEVRGPGIGMLVRKGAHGFRRLT